MMNQTQKHDLQLADQAANMMQILVIDDSEADRARIVRLCEEAGLSFVATEVSTIAAMGAALETRNFDLVFIDYLLAGEDGLEAVDLLNQHPEQKAASIMVAGEGQIGVAVEAMRRGCSDYLTKSEMTVPALQKSVATALERRMLGYALREERAIRLELERSVRQYANNCSAEMRSILAATLRRVRKLRSQTLSDDNALEFGALEASIDRLWEALPAFGHTADKAIEQTKRPTTGAEITLLRPH